MSNKRVRAAAAVVAVAVVLALAWRFGPRSGARRDVVERRVGEDEESGEGRSVGNLPIANLDPRRIAEVEARMWKAYYAGTEDAALGLELVGLLREQFGLSMSDAILVGKDLLTAAITFRGTPLAEHDEKVLPCLEQAYTRARAALGGTWDAKAVAHAELSWWQARRRCEATRTVGMAIAREYALLYGETNEHVERAGLLRAQASRLRDRGGLSADWDRIQEMLEDSYGSLVRGVLE